MKKILIIVGVLLGLGLSGAASSLPQKFFIFMKTEMLLIITN